jgi:hypothetical protein
MAASHDQKLIGGESGGDGSRPSPPPSFWLVVVEASVLVVVRVEFESFELQALPDGLELFLVLESHPIQQVKSRLVEPFFMSAPCSDIPTGCHDFYS